MPVPVHLRNIKLCTKIGEQVVTQEINLNDYASDFIVGRESARYIDSEVLVRRLRNGIAVKERHGLISFVKEQIRFRSSFEFSLHYKVTQKFFTCSVTRNIPPKQAIKTRRTARSMTVRKIFKFD